MKTNCKMPLLSLCIPTYNRADVLKDCLKSIVDSDSFSDEVEVVISDNCSTDSTRLVVESYSLKYHNIKYYHNENNIGGDRNILHSLELGSGIYLKLLNDYSIFLPGGLQFLLNCVKDNIEEKPALYISRRVVSGCEHVIINNLDEILRIERWGLSWIGNYGYWKEDFMSFDNKDRRINTNFQQVDWLIRSFHLKKRIVYYSHPITYRKPFKSKQGDYNFFKVHTQNFFIQFQELVDNGEISRKSLELAKKDVLKGLMYWVIVLKLDKKHYAYDSEGQYKILKEQFGSYSWFYPTIVSGFFSTLSTFFMEKVTVPLYRLLKPLKIKLIGK